MLFGSQWQIGIGVLLAGLVLLMLLEPTSWLPAAELVVRAALTGWPRSPVWYA